MNTATLKPRKREALSGAFRHPTPETPDAQRSGALRQLCMSSRLSLRSAGISVKEIETPERRRRIRGLWTFLQQIPALRFAWPGFQPFSETPDAQRSGASQPSGTSSRLSLRSAGISAKGIETPEARSAIRGLWPFLREVPALRFAWPGFQINLSFCHDPPARSAEKRERAPATFRGTSQRGCVAELKDSSRLSLRSAGISVESGETPERRRRIRGLWTFLQQIPALRFAWPGFQPFSETPDAQRSGAFRPFGTSSRLSLRSAGISVESGETPERRRRIRGLWTFLKEVPALRFAWPGFQAFNETPDAQRSGAFRPFGTSSRLSLRSAGISLLVLPALMLSGCFTSDVELIGSREAVRAMPPGEYTHTPFDTEGVEWGGITWSGRIEYGFFSRRYTSDAENFPHQNVRLRRLSGNTYIGQLPREDGYAYGIVFVYPDMTTYHQADCHVLSADQLEEAGIVRDPEGFCSIDTLDQLEEVIRTYLEILDGDVRIDGIYRRVG